VISTEPATTVVWGHPALELVVDVSPDGPVAVRSLTGGSAHDLPRAGQPLVEVLVAGEGRARASHRFSETAVGRRETAVSDQAGVLADLIERLGPVLSVVADAHAKLQAAPEHVRCAVVTVSDTRTVETDRSGQMIKDRLTQAGHEVVHYLIVKDDPPEGAQVVNAAIKISQIAGASAPPTGPSLEWDEQDQVFVLADPYLLFYLRWSGILEREAEADT